MNTLGMVFTIGVSLEQWVKQGLISREKLIYEEHLKQGHFDKVIWFTYGKSDVKVRDELVGKGILDSRIQVIEMPAYFFGKKKALWYSYLIPYIHRRYCKTLDYIKTNQMEGAWTAEIISKIYNIPFILRSGYTVTALLENKQKDIPNQRKYKKYRKIEKKLYHKCDVAMVSSKHDREYVCSSYNIDANKVKVLPNYIDCTKFYPRNDVEKFEQRFIFVGRLSNEKNLFHIIEAIGQLGLGIDIYGQGELKQELESFIKRNGYDAQLKGSVDNQKLPMVYNQYKYYIIASPFEGMPKTLLEAMACGLVCFGTNTSGISEIIQDGYNGYLIEDTSVEKIIEKLESKLLDSENTKISKTASKYIKKNYSISEIVKMEWDVINN